MQAHLQIDPNGEAIKSIDGHDMSTTKVDAQSVKAF